MGKLADTDINGDLTITGKLLINGTNLLDTINSIKSIVDILNNCLSDDTSGRLILPSGLKIFYGVAQLSETGDPVGNYSAKVTFPESYYDDNNYFFTARATVCGSLNNRNDDLRNYYERTNTHIYVGSKTIAGAWFNWFSIGY